MGKLAPKVKRFNDFIALYPELYSTFRMWHYDNGRRSSPYGVSKIPEDLVKKRVFIFLGREQLLKSINYDELLRDLDTLLPLYEYVESESVNPISMQQTTFSFSPGWTAKSLFATATLTQRTIDVSLRHNELQRVLCEKLASQYGKDNIGSETRSGVGTRIDVVVRQGDQFWFYEIKTYLSPRACIREAIGQLLEYSHWPGAKRASRLIVVGESPLDDDGSEYLRRLKNELALPIEYEQIPID